tara:strand:+ start:610 stop:1116 length:507 start_codon:yes stop_codon:yes gene_type:complete
MQSSILASINQNLKRLITLINSVDNQIYTEKSIGPYYSSIGSHIRHSLDFFNCIIEGLQHNDIDLTARKRDARIAEDRNSAVAAIYNLQQELASLKDMNSEHLLHITDNLGDGKVTIIYTLEGILAQGNTHTIHHSALIAYILHSLGKESVVKELGFNPTTPLDKDNN